MANNLIAFYRNVKRMGKSMSEILENHMISPFVLEEHQILSEIECSDFDLYHLDKSMAHLKNSSLYHKEGKKEEIDTILDHIQDLCNHVEARIDELTKKLRK